MSVFASGWALTSLVLAVLIFCLPPQHANAQTIRGHVLEGTSDLRMEGVEVVLLDSAGQAVRRRVSNGDGGFSISAPAAGRYRLRGERLGYAPTESEEFQVGAGEVLVVEFRMSIRPVDLNGLRVVARRPRESLWERDMRQFRERIDEYAEYRGIRIFDREELERVAGWSLSDVLRLRPGRRCESKVYWNGVRKKPWELDRRIPIESLEGVEFYSGMWAPNSMFMDEDGCGVTLIWTRQ